ncbi:zonadhesin-like isoform X5 [Cotesia glomerata]|uniref:zonadhesin-like isoform X5 n=1 Tax=Cotesia glomerata TaxID=32391 RepID=UPI001D02C246|nr:zonadhesin-like isoform X5 [Cotesia glomerata]
MARFLLISVVLIAALIVGINASNCQKCKGKNEEWKSCGACDSTCRNKHVVCPKICKLPGSCGCKTGYVRNSRRICVKKENCPGPNTCGKNEEFYPCGACDQGCNYLAKCSTKCRKGSCGCKKGYVRNENKICIKKQNCPKTNTCGKNEVFYPYGACDQGCNYATRCTTECRKGSCGCKQGYVRNDKKICIPQESCPKVCGINEEYMPCGACDQGCDYAVDCIQGCREGACGCKSGYLRSNGTCVLSENCPKNPICGPNEEIKRCGACDGTCREPSIACTKICREPECGCMKGYVRNNGKCILLKSCPKTPTCGPNEELKECGACDGNCEEKYVPCTADCRLPECGCKSDYVRNNGTCILYESCPKTPTCGPNEEIKGCGACDGTCEEKDVPCTADCRRPECGCKSDYVRNNGTCILYESCPKTPTCGPNEEIKGCGACDGTCEEKDVPCTTDCRRPECGCKSGYVRNNGKCILYEKCRKTPTCGPNEEIKGCGACDGTCEEKDVPCTADCRLPECGCKSGYVRNNGTCILYKSCPKTPTCGPNEEIKGCGACDGTCEEKDVPCTTDCRLPECGCKSGYVRNNGTCILYESCPKIPTCGPNEEIKGCGACDGTCEEKDVPCTADCRLPECGCKSGYVRNNGTCILYKSCPKTPTCGPNEEIKGCGACDGTCEEKDVPCTTDCRLPECGCKSGYVRNNGTCILYESCPKIPTCGPNEEIKGCGACDGTCEEKDVPCTADCRRPECGCKSGYVRNNGTCILYKSCPKTPTCGPNEEIKGCGACDGTCKEPNVACTLDCRLPECGCKSGYVRNNGKCILYEKCRKTPTCGPNEEIKGCGACDGTCEEKDVPCTADCRLPECGCKSGYVRNNGKCILYEKCRKTPSCGPNEELKPCGACDGTCKKPHPMCTKDCRQPECGCIKGFYRNDDLKCVSLLQCPIEPKQ